MKKKHILFGLLGACLFAPVLFTSKPVAAATDATHPGFKVVGRDLYDLNDEKTTLYGINKMIVWMDKDGDPSFKEIAKTGANCCRIVWTMKDGTAEELDTAITNCRAEHMIPIIELHDATGEFDKLPSLVDWWISPDVVKVIQKHQEYLLVNIGNEVGNGNISDATFTEGYTDAILRMRKAGIHVPLLIDASSWGQDINKLQACGPDLIKADPDSNIMLSVHCWWPKMYGHNAEEVYKEFKESYDMELPLVVGEFANQWEETEQGQIPYKEVMECCAKYGYGYLIWSWGPGNNPQTFLDMTTDSSYDTLQPWAKEMIYEDEYALNKLAKIPASMRAGLPAQKPVSPLPSGNLALGKDAVCSSVESNAYTASNTTDGDLSSRWASNSGSSTDWLYVDLGESKDISKVLINWENAYATQFQVQVSDDATTWQEVYRTYNGKGGLQEIELDKACKARYVRVYCTQKFNYSWGYSIFELGVYGPESENFAVVENPVAVFDKNVKKQESISFNINENGNKLTDIKNGDYTLTEGKDFTLKNSVLTLNKSYLASLEKGTYNFILTFDNNSAIVISVAIGDTTPIGEPVIILGDCDNNGVIDISDYTILKKYINTNGNVNINKDNADINEDGQVSFLDLLALKTLMN